MIAMKSFVRGVAVLMTFALVSLTALPRADANSKPQFGDIETFAGVPATPGFPQGISVDGNLVYVSGPAVAGTAGTLPSLECRMKNLGIARKR